MDQNTFLIGEVLDMAEEVKDQAAARGYIVEFGTAINIAVEIQRSRVLSQWPTTHENHQAILEKKLNQELDDIAEGKIIK